MANFNWLIIAGHGAGDGGAQGKVGKYNGILECNKTRELVNLIVPKAQKLKDVGVYVYPTDRNAFYDAQNGVLQKVLNSNFPGVKFHYAFEVHFNAFNISAYGTECFVVPEEGGITVEQAIMKNMGKFFTLRDNDNIFDGVKRTRFLVINCFKQMGVSGALLETCFIDNPADMDIYEAKKDAIAQGIVDGIATGFGLVVSNSTVTPSPQPAPKPATNIPSQTYAGFAKNDVVTLSAKATVYQGASKGVAIPPSVKGKNYTVQQISSDGKCLLLKELYSWVLTSECAKKGSTPAPTPKPVSTEIKVGDKVKATSRTDYNGVVNFSWVLDVTFTVMEVNGNRVVIGRNGQVTGAWAKSNLRKVG